MTSLSFNFFGDPIRPDEYDETYGLLNDYVGEAKLVCKVAGDYAERHDGHIRMVDVGCGTGLLLSEIEKCRGGQKIIGTGIDKCRDFVEYACHRNLKNTSFLLHDVCDLHLPDNTFDLALFSTYLIQAAADYQSLKSFVYKFSSWLSPCGILAFSFIDSKLYSDKYDDGPVEIVLPDTRWIAEGFTQYEPSLSRRFFKLSFTNVQSNRRFGSQAYYLDLSCSYIEKVFGEDFLLEFVRGECVGIQDDGCRLWAILGKQ